MMVKKPRCVVWVTSCLLLWRLFAMIWRVSWFRNTCCTFRVFYFEFRVSSTLLSCFMFLDAMLSWSELCFMFLFWTSMMYSLDPFSLRVEPYLIIKIKKNSMQRKPSLTPRDKKFTRLNLCWHTQTKDKNSIRLV